MRRISDQLQRSTFMPRFARILFLLILGAAAQASAAAADSNCTPARQARAKVTVSRMHWVQKNGAYHLSDDLVCSGQQDLGVLPGVAAGCISPVLLKCQIQLDGVKHVLNVSGSIYHNDTPFAQTKHFSAGYHLDRNTSGIKTGEAASTDIHTADLALKKIGVEMQSKLDSPNFGTPTRDGFSITVDFEDPDAI
jgi:hypothetical protein